MGASRHLHRLLSNGNLGGLRPIAFAFVFHLESSWYFSSLEVLAGKDDNLPYTLGVSVL